MDVTVKESAPERLKRLTGFDVFCCPKCNKGKMMEVGILPRIRSSGRLRHKLNIKHHIK
ncbi:MAG: hypothetical protein H0S84_11555 [Bacteroidales bacterium]|nr:hypothetical protein [Bacteroidales bacterium]